MIVILWLLLEFAASTLISYVVLSEIEYRRWGRLAGRVFMTDPIANLTPPTVTELNAHSLGYDLALIPREAS